MIPHFTPIALPALAIRRTDLANQLRRKSNTFARLLAQVSPRLYERTTKAAPTVIAGTRFDTWNYYVALINWCSKRFPVWLPDYLVEEFSADDEMEACLGEMGIPVDPLGVREEELYNGLSPTLGIVAYLLEKPAQRVSADRLRENHVGDVWRNMERLQPYLDREIQFEFSRPPRGRQWIGRWQNLPMLVQYIYHDTGYQWLDICEDEMDEGGNPPWSIDDMNFLANDWTLAKRVWQNLRDFMQWLDGNPQGYLPTALAALTGDEQVRAAISRPIRSKTLGEVFDAQDKKARG